MALVAPAGPVTDRMIHTALQRCRHLGLEPMEGAALRSRAGYLAGPDPARADDLRWGLEEADAVWAVRGGYGTLRTLDHVVLDPVRERPVPFIGFSDNTVVHMALHQRGVTSFHGPHAGYEHFTRTTETVFRAVLWRAIPAGVLPMPTDAAPVPLNGGVAEGRLLGGNLAMLAALCGTPYQPNTRGAILFLEDVSEPLYRIDRMVTQLRLAGVFEGVAGIAVGDFPGGDEPDAGLFDVFRDRLAPLGVPVLAGLPFGHGTENWTLPLGIPARLDAGGGTLAVLEPAVSEGEGATV